MSILHRYLLKEFLKPLLFVTVVFVGIYVIAQLVDDMRMFVAHHPPLSVIILYYFFRVPYYAVQVMPLAVLLSVLLALGQLARNNELIALRGCGVSFYQVTAPLLAAALVISLLVLGFDEVVIPLTNPRAEYIKKVNIEQKADQMYRYRRDRVARSVSGNRVLYMRHLDALAGKMQKVIYLELGPNLDVRKRLDARSARWRAGAWLFSDGILRVFDPSGGLTRFEPFTQLAIRFKESPREFVREEKDADQLLSMTLPDLRTRIRLLKEMGSNTNKEEVNLQLKFAFPFANFILVLLGISLPFIFPSGRRALLGAAIGFIITITTGFFYIGFIAIGTSLGNNGTFSPFVSVWIANVSFGLLGAWLMRLANR